MRTFGRIVAAGVMFLAFIVMLYGSRMPAEAAQTAIQGIVYNASSGSPVAGAKLTLTGNGTEHMTTSDATGAFAFSNIAAGTWSLRTTAASYELSVSGAIVANAGQTVSLSVALQPVSSTNITTLGHVTVRGQAAVNTSSAATTTIYASDYVNTGAQQVQTLLESTPGISIEHFDNGAPGNVATFSIRGAGGFAGGANTGYEVLVLQDGEPIRNGQYGDADLSGLTPAIYSRVEVVKGVGGTSLFGANTVGGTLNLVTIDPKATEGAEALWTAGGFGTSSYDLSQTNTYGRVGYVFDYHEYGTDGFDPSNLRVDSPPCTFCSSPTPPVGAIVHPTNAMLLHSGLAKIRYDMSSTTYGVLTVTDEADWRDQFGLILNPETVTVSSGSSFSNDPFGFPYYYGFPMNYVWNTDPKYAFDLHTPMAGGALVLRYYDNWINRWVDGNNAPAASCCYLQKSIDHLSGELATWDKVLGNHDLALAIGGNSDAFQYGFCATSNVFCKASDISPTVGTQIERTALARDDWEISSKFKSTFAGYYSNYSDLNVRRFDPRLAIVNQPDENSIVRFSVGSGFAAPRLSDIVTPLDLSAFTNVNGPNCPPSEFYCDATSGNPSIRPETAFGYDLGYERRWGPVGDFALDLYRTSLQNHIFTGILPAPPGLVFSDGTPVLGIEEPINIANTIYQGIELTGSVPVSTYFAVKGYYNTQAAYPLNVDFQTEQVLGDVVNNQQYLDVPLHKLGWTVNFQNHQGVGAFLGADWNGPNNSYNVPQFWVYNAGMGLPLSDTMGLHLAWRNIFNKDAIIIEQYGQGVPYSSVNGATTSTNAYSYMPHIFSVTLDERIGSLK